MREVENKVAFVTGGASGIGLGMAEAFLAAGMRVIIADVREEALEAALQQLNAGARCHALALDVSDRDAMRRAADAAESIFGTVHVLCNNAGVGVLGGAKEVRFDDWDWSLAVNLGGVINGVQIFLPRMLGSGQDCHIVNTSTIGAVAPGPGAIAYLSAKAAVQVLSECLANDLADECVGVTVLIPGPARTQIHQVAALRPARFQDSGVRELEAQLARGSLFGNQVEPRQVGEWVLDAIRRDLLFVFTHPDFKPGIDVRHAALMAAIPAADPDPERIKAFGFPVVNPLYEEILRRAEPPPGTLRGKS